MRSNEPKPTFIMTRGDMWTEIKADAKERIGPTLTIRSLSYGQLLHSSEIMTDCESLRELGEYLIEKSKELQAKKDNGMFKEYVHKLSHKGN